MKYSKWLLVFVPLSIISNYIIQSSLLKFVLACLAIIPLAMILTWATEEISNYTGPRIGGLFSATMSNIPELMIGIAAVRSQMYDLVLYSMSGAIIGNILLVLGASTFLGGIGRKFQYFNKNNARSNFLLLLSCAFGIIIPFALSQNNRVSHQGLTYITFCISFVMLCTYIAGLIFSLITHKSLFCAQVEEVNKDLKKPNLYKWFLLLIFLTVTIAIESDILVGQVEALVNGYGMSKLFIGIVIIPLLGNVAENMSAVVMAIKDKIDNCIEIAIGSSIQIALFVAPVLVLLTFILGKPMVYVFGSFEIVAILASIGVSLFVFQDGKTNWLEGVVLIGGYIMLAIAFLFI